MTPTEHRQIELLRSCVADFEIDTDKAQDIADTIERLAEIADAADNLRKIQIDQQGSVLTKYDTMRRIQAETALDAALQRRG